MIKNTAGQEVSAQLIAKTDGSDVTSGTTTVYYVIDGGAQGTGSSATHKGNGCWSYAPAQAETNGAHIAYTFVNTNAVSTTVNVYTVGQDFTAATLNANATQLGGATVTATTSVTIPASSTLATTTGAVGSVTSPVTAGTVSDKTGYALTAAYDPAKTAAQAGDAMTLTAAYDAAKTAAQAGDAMTLDPTAVDAIWAKTMTELSAVPGVTASVLSALEWVFTVMRNKRTQDDTTETLYKDDGTTPIATSAKSFVDPTFTRGKYS